MNVLLGITGGIAAYKCPLLVRELQQRGADVRVVMTQAAERFVTPWTLQALSGHRVRTALFDPDAEAAMGHIELARWSDRVVIAPTSADMLARLAQGRADDLISTLCLATEAPLLLAPAMNRVMWAHAATQHNLAVLRERGATVIGPAAGEQACGEVGAGRMAEPAEIATALYSGPLSGKTVLVTAGPTREPIDPVRFISNRSSGRMGYAVAAAARDAGARVQLVSGPVALDAPSGVGVVRVETARQMHEQVMRLAMDVDCVIATAAVGDYRPHNTAAQKIKRAGKAPPELTLVENPDIVADVAALPARPFVVGFAAETEHALAHGRDKLQRKALDMIAINDVSAASPGGFDSADNALTVLWQGGQQTLSLKNKERIATELVELVAEHYAKSRN